MAIAGGVSSDLAVTAMTVAQRSRARADSSRAEPDPRRRRACSGRRSCSLSSAFLPWCHLERGHAVVAILTDRFPIAFRRGGRVHLGRRHARRGVLDRLASLDRPASTSTATSESTFILRVPLWIIYSAGHDRCGDLRDRRRLLHRAVGAATRCPARSRPAGVGSRRMSNVELGLWSFPVLLGLIFLRMPIGLAMLVVGVVGNYLITKRWNPSLALFKSLTYSTFSNYSLSVIPLFLLMGQFASLGGISNQLVRCCRILAGSPQGWRGDGGNRRLRGLRRNLRVVAGDRRNDGSDRPARIAQARLLGRACNRDPRSGRHARHPHPAVGDPRHLRDPD